MFGIRNDFRNQQFSGNQLPALLKEIVIVFPDTLYYGPHRGQSAASTRDSPESPSCRVGIPIFGVDAEGGEVFFMSTQKGGSQNRTPLLRRHVSESGNAYVLPCVDTSTHKKAVSKCLNLVSTQKGGGVRFWDPTFCVDICRNPKILNRPCRHDSSCRKNPSCRHDENFDTALCVLE